MKKLLIGIAIISLVFFSYITVYSQTLDIDLQTATYEQIHIWLLGIVTYIWGLLGKFIPGLKEKEIPRALVVGIPIAALGLVAVYNGVGSIWENLGAVLSVQGGYTWIKDITDKLPFLKFLVGKSSKPTV